jgi:hypothetical protein
VRPWIAASLLYALLATILWLPFGFRTTGLVEEWDLMWLHDRGELLWWVTGGGALAYMRLRPLFAVLNELNSTLGSGFLWLNVVALLIFVCVGLATFLLVERLAPGLRAVALVAGTFAMLYPANSGLFTFRVIHIRASVALFLFALVVLSDFSRAPKVWRFALMSLLLGASLLMYQIAALALVVGPLVVLLSIGLDDKSALLKRSALWFATPAAVGCYWLLIATQGGTYEVTSASAAPRPSVRAYVDDLVRSYVDQLYSAWRPAAWASWETRYLVIGGFCGVLIAVVAWTAAGSGRLGNRNVLLGSLGVIAIAPLGFLPLWAIVASIHESLKIYLLSSIAVAVGLALLLAYICRSRTPFAIASGLLVGLAAVYALQQHAHYVALSKAETRILGSLVQELPSPRDGTVVVVRDHSGQLSLVWTLGPPITFSSAVEVAFHNPTLAVVLCNESTGVAYLTGKPIQACPDGRVTRPATASYPALEMQPARMAVFDYDLVHEMRLVERRSGTLPAGYAPLKLIGKGRQSRKSLFACMPIQRCTKSPSALWPRGSIHETFGTESTNVTGFRPAETTPEGSTFRWSISRKTHAYAFLPPRDARLALRVLYVIEPAVANSLRLQVNGHDVPLAVRPVAHGYLATATVPGENLRGSPDDIEFASDVFPVTGSFDPLGIAVTRLDVEPTPESR